MLVDRRVQTNQKERVRKGEFDRKVYTWRERVCHKDDENREERVVVQGGKVKWYLHNCMGLGR